MLSCLTVLGKASSALAKGEHDKGNELLASVVNCTRKQTCHSRTMCSIATMGILRDVTTDGAPA